MAGKATAEQLWRGLLRGPFRTKATSATNQWAGVTTIPSGSATATVSTTIVDSDSIILYGQLGNANVGSAAPGSATATPPFEVKTIAPGAFFTLGTLTGQALASPARDTKLMWLVVKTQ